MLNKTHNGRDIQFNVAMGLVPDMQNIEFFGAVPTTSVNRQIVYDLGGDIEDSLKFPTAVQTIYASSDNALDTNVTIKIIALDDNYDEVVYQVNLNGQTAIQLPAPIKRINFAMNVGSVPLVGNVYLGNESAPVGGVPALANTMAYVSAEFQSSHSLSYTVPAGYSFFATELSGGNTRREENSLTGCYTLGENGVFICGLEIQLVAEYVALDIIYFKVQEKSDLVVTTISENTNPDAVRGRFTGMLVKNTLIEA